MKNEIHWENLKAFITAGRAIFTVTSKVTENRFTFRVTMSKSKKFFYVDVLVGRDNTKDYKYIGYIGKNEAFYPTHADRPSVTAFSWLWSKINLEPDNPSRLIEIRHEGKCARCGRKLTVPESIDSGFGPECVNIVKQKNPEVVWM
jgi:hypothetical protein